MLDKKDLNRKQKSDQMNKMAKMRFNIGIEKSKRADLEKDVEVEDVNQKLKKKIEAEVRLRKNNLVKATNENQRLHYEVKI